MQVEFFAGGGGGVVAEVDQVERGLEFDFAVGGFHCWIVRAVCDA